MNDSKNLMVMSNRGPISSVRDASGQIHTKRGAGGLVVTLGPGVERDGALWMSATTVPEEPAVVDGIRYQPVQIDQCEYSGYYDVIANEALWFCLHGLWDLPRQPRFDRRWWAAWESFKAVNEQFAVTADELAAPGATILIQDYHLALVGEYLAKRRPDLRTTTFLHIPWCTPEELAVLPDEVALAVLSGLAGGGSVGFHSRAWAASFEACCKEVLGYNPTIYVAPAAPDAQDLQAVAASPGCTRELESLRRDVGDRRLIVRVDRIELSKNVLRGFWAFDELLEERPDLRGEVVFAAMVYPSRQSLSEYQTYGRDVIEAAQEINSKWATDRWTPILVDPEDNYPRSVAALRLFDVLLVNPVRDGLNLVAKEGPMVNERDGIVVLSHRAGVWDELGGYTLGVNPFDVSATAAALGRALDMPGPDRAEMAAGARRAAYARTPLDWFDDQLSHAATA